MISTDKRFILAEKNSKWYGAIFDLHQQDKPMRKEEIVELLNSFNEENIKLKSICRDHRDYANDVEADYMRLEVKVKETLQKYFNKYTQMAVELRHDKYANGMCHEVTEAIQEIGYELGVELE